MTQSTSYILVSSSTQAEEVPESPQYASLLPDSRPRFHLVLPLIAALDAIATIVLGWLIVRREDDRQKLVLAVAGCALLRASTIAIVGISKRIRDIGIIVAAVCILSALYDVSVANLLFQARGKPDDPVESPPNTKSTSPTIAILLFFQASITQSRLLGVSVHPTMSVLIGTQMAFTLLEWISYVAIVGVKVPPGSNPVKTRRWARSLNKDPRFREGHVQASSLYSTDSEPEDADESEPGEEASLIGGVRTPIQSPKKGYGSIRVPRGSLRLTKSKVPFHTSPSDAELAISSSREQDDQEEEQEEEDPDEIINIPSNCSLQRQASRRRLALAAHPERRISGNLGLGGAPAIRQTSTGKSSAPSAASSQSSAPESRQKQKKLPAWLSGKKRQQT